MKVMQNEDVPTVRNSGRDTTINSSRSLKVGLAEAVPIETPALEASKVLPDASAQDNIALQAGMVDFLLSSCGRL